MEQLFLNYQLSLLAKEKGFDEPCFARYIKKEFRFAALGGVTNFSKEQAGQISAPLYQQITDWFMEKHLIYVSTTYSKHHGYDGLVDTHQNVYLIGYKSTQHDAMSAALKVAFELI